MFLFVRRGNRGIVEIIAATNEVFMRGSGSRVEVNFTALQTINR